MVFDFLTVSPPAGSKNFEVGVIDPPYLSEKCETADHLPPIGSVIMVKYTVCAREERFDSVVLLIDSTLGLIIFCN